MNISKYVRSISFLVLVLVSGCGKEYELEDYTNVEIQKSNLVYGLTSYMNINDVVKKLSIEPNEIIIKEDSSSPIQDGIPPFNILTAEIMNTEIEGFIGLMSVSFFNNRLMEVRFYPENTNEFIKTIKGLSMSNQVEMKPFTNIRIDRDYQKKDYVSWIDSRLKKQFLYWIKIYT